MTASDMATPPVASPGSRGILGWTWKDVRGFLFVLPWLVGFVLFVAGPFFFSFFLGGTKFLNLSMDPFSTRRLLVC